MNFKVYEIEIAYKEVILTHEADIDETERLIYYIWELKPWIT